MKSLIFLVTIINSPFIHVIYMYIYCLPGINAYVLHASLNPSWNQSVTHRRRLFLMDLGLSLIDYSPIETTIIISRSSGHEGSRKRGRCISCPRALDKKARLSCNSCGGSICRDHTFCQNCA